MYPNQYNIHQFLPHLWAFLQSNNLSLAQLNPTLPMVEEVKAEFSDNNTQRFKITSEVNISIESSKPSLVPHKKYNMSQNTKIKKSNAEQFDFMARKQNQKRNVNSNILKSYLRYCIQIQPQLNKKFEHFTKQNDQINFITQLKKRININQHYMKTNTFKQLVNEKTTFGKIIRITLNRFLKKIVPLVVLNSNRYKKKQKFHHIRTRYELMKQLTS